MSLIRDKSERNLVFLFLLFVFFSVCIFVVDITPTVGASSPSKSSFQLGLSKLLQAINHASEAYRRQDTKVENVLCPFHFRCYLIKLRARNQTQSAGRADDESSPLRRRIKSFFFFFLLATLWNVEGSFMRHEHRSAACATTKPLICYLIRLICFTLALITVLLPFFFFFNKSWNLFFSVDKTVFLFHPFIELFLHWLFTQTGDLITSKKKFQTVVKLHWPEL